MSLQLPLTALQNNDNTYYFNATFNGDPLDLTPYAPRVVVKATQTTTDGSATIYNIGGGLSYVTQTLGRLKFVLPHAATTTAGIQWWRLDIVDGGGFVSTVFYGPLTIKAV
jgi:hypothetical protein